MQGFAPIISVNPFRGGIALGITPAIRDDSALMRQLRLMLAVVLAPIGRIRGVLERDLRQFVDVSEGSLQDWTAHQLNCLLAELPTDPVVRVLRDSDPQVWRVTVQFTAQPIHANALCGLPDVWHAVVSDRPVYGGQVLELFVPELDASNVNGFPSLVKGALSFACGRPVPGTQR